MNSNRLFQKFQGQGYYGMDYAGDHILQCILEIDLSGMMRPITKVRSRFYRLFLYYSPRYFPRKGIKKS